MSHSQDGGKKRTRGWRGKEEKKEQEEEGGRGEGGAERKRGKKGHLDHGRILSLGPCISETLRT